MEKAGVPVNCSIDVTHSHGIELLSVIVRTFGYGLKTKVAAPDVS